jgi:ABC-type multidrug transport system ATPase subunit
MIKLVDIVQHYGVRPILRDVNLEIPDGQLVALVGPNGVGKTTMLALMGGVLSPQKGYVEINGLRRRSSVEDELEIRRQAVYLPDQPWYPRGWTARNYLHAVGRLYEIDDERLFRHSRELFRLFNLAELADSTVHSYSAGQKKKFGLCTALITEAPILLLDEPFSGGLDPAGIQSLRKVLRFLVDEQGTTVVMSTPVPEIIERLADRVIVIDEGKIVADGTPEELQASAGQTATLADALEQMVFPQASESIEQYFRELAQ